MEERRGNKENRKVEDFERRKSNKNRILEKRMEYREDESGVRRAEVGGGKRLED